MCKLLAMEARDVKIWWNKAAKMSNVAWGSGKVYWQIHSLPKKLVLDLVQKTRSWCSIVFDTEIGRHEMSRKDMSILEPSCWRFTSRCRKPNKRVRQVPLKGRPKVWGKPISTLGPTYCMVWCGISRGYCENSSVSFAPEIRLLRLF